MSLSIGDTNFTSDRGIWSNRIVSTFPPSSPPTQAWYIVPYKQRPGEPKMYEPDLPIIYLNRAYMTCEFQHIGKPNITHKFPTPYLNNRLVRKTQKIMLTIDANTHSYYNIWGVDSRFEPTFQVVLPRSTFTLQLIR